MENKRSANSFFVFIELYKGNYKKVLLALVFFIIKHSPVWIMPIVLSNIINILSRTDHIRINDLVMSLVLIVILVITNVPATLIHSWRYCIILDLFCIYIRRSYKCC